MIFKVKPIAKVVTCMPEGPISDMKFGFRAAHKTQFDRVSRFLQTCMFIQEPPDAYTSYALPVGWLVNYLVSDD
jgi:hypothetical protein